MTLRRTPKWSLVQSTEAQLFERARRRLSWAQEELGTMNSAAMLDDDASCERCFSRILSDIAAAHEGICNAQGVNSPLAKTLQKQRKSDPLLYYFWHARNVDVHHLLERQITSHSAFVQIVDGTKAKSLVGDATTSEGMNKRFWQAIMALPTTQASPSSPFPSEAALAEIGLRVVRQRSAFSLNPFSYYNHRNELTDVGSPDEHLGVSISNSADGASKLAIAFYDSYIPNDRGPE